MGSFLVLVAIAFWITAGVTGEVMYAVAGVVLTAAGVTTFWIEALYGLNGLPGRQRKEEGKIV
jgi:hypothetical protein